ncbi:MAG: hypothetical protein A3J38_02090 [Gammaproteobacteria bacterium RIFCSPHIGHO2_12_FULL_45_9]|nr:MAG: hypothetical protein A3J38_02090 [Gammaproteobacteria bacterium RIFCSPHIGHO2_12_FULL_45_9]
MSLIISNRDPEKALLAEMLASDKAEFLTIYGRRRIGKTFLIREFFEKNKKVLFFKAVGLKQGTMATQLKNFVTQISTTFYNGAQLTSSKNWKEAFSLLTNAINSAQVGKRKIVLFLDELPWMATKNSNLLQNLDYFWNLHWSVNPTVKLIACGSSASWMINKIINNKGGLHNRTTRKIHLRPFTLKEIKEFLKSKKVSLSNEQITQLYMVTGGVPFYLSNITPGLSAAQIIEQLAFSPDGLLLDEFNALFSSLFDDHTIYIEMLRIIAESQAGIGQDDLLKRFEKSLQGKGGLDKLQALEDADFIISFKPHFHKKKGIYYKVIDEYTLFYFHWIEPIKETLQNRNLEKGNWLELQNTPAWNTWCGYAFEAICYKHVSAIRNTLGISPSAIANSWRYAPTPSKGSTERGAQIDLLFDRQDDTITLCEIKYTKDPFAITKDYAEILRRKMTIFKERTKTKKHLVMAMITAHGLKNNPIVLQNKTSEDLISGVVTLDDFFH